MVTSQSRVKLGREPGQTVIYCLGMAANGGYYRRMVRVLALAKARTPGIFEPRAQRG